MKPLPIAPSLILVRHASVDPRYDGLCYGQSDVTLSSAGEQLSEQLAEQLSIWTGATILHSGLQRTRFLAERISLQMADEFHECSALQERFFGGWELRSWDEIHEETGDKMLGMITEPATYRPGGGETTFELRDRVLRWYRALPRRLTIAVTHGGPIAALRGTLGNMPVSDWAHLIPGHGQIVIFDAYGHERPRIAKDAG